MTNIPQVFISYARRDGEAFANALRLRLEQAAIPAWQDRAGLEGGRDWWLQITAALDTSQFLILVMTPAALVSPIVQREWRYARQRGVCIYPVKGVPDNQINFGLVPRWMRDVHWYTLDHEWEKFLADLQQECQAPRVPFMAEDLPDDFVPRPDEFAALHAALLHNDGADPVAITAALRGAGGYGKTTLARALCHDSAIQEAFDDGVLWITLGEKPLEALTYLNALIGVLTGEDAKIALLDAARTRLRELLAQRDVLIVVDDVWNAAHLKPFLDLGPRCAYLITTRNDEVLPRGVIQIRVDAMQAAEACDLLAAGVEVAADHAPLLDLARRLGYWALLLKLANGVIRGRLEKGQAVDQALHWVNRALDKYGLVAFDPRNPLDRNQAVTTTLQVSLEMLTPAEITRYSELAIFPEDIDIPLAALEKLWGATGNLDDFECEALCERLFGLSLLLNFDPVARSIRLHDVLRAYLIETLPQKNGAGEGIRLKTLPSLWALHQQFLAAYRPAAAGEKGGSPWARLPTAEPYLWDWLPYHLIEGGLEEELLEAVSDWRYLAAKVYARSARAAESDVERVPLSPAQRMIKHMLANDGHILDRARSLGEALATFYSRIKFKYRITADLLAPLEAALPTPCLVPLHPVPDLPHLALLRTISERGILMTDCAISPDDQWIVATLDDGRVKIWDAASGIEKRTLIGHEGAVNCCAISPDGAWLVTGGQDRLLHVWDAASGQIKFTLKGHSAQVQDCQVDPEGAWIVSVGDDKSVRLWDAHAGTPLQAWYGHEKRVWACGITPDGSTILTLGEDKKMIGWEVESGQILFTYETDLDSRCGLAISSDGQWAAAPTLNGGVTLREIASGKLQYTLLGHAAVARCCAFDPQGTYVITGASDSTVRVWELDSGREVGVLTGHGGRVSACQVSGDGHWLLSASGDGTLKTWILAPDLFGRGGGVIPHTRGVRGCAISPDGQWAVSASSDHTLKIWDFASGRVIRTLSGHAGFVNSVAISPDGRWILSAGHDWTLRVWESSTGREVAIWRGHRGKVQACAISPDGTWALSGAYDHTLKVWDVASGSEKMTLIGHTAQVQTCTISPDGTRIVSGGRDATLRVWEAASGAELLRFEGHTENIWGCAVSPDGRWVVSAPWEWALKVWDLHTGEVRHTLGGHRAATRDCTFSPDGRLILSAANDRTLKLWAVESGECLTTLYTGGEMLSCTWHPDGRQVMATGRSGVYFLKVWG